MLNQPADELGKLEAILGAFADYEDLQTRRANAKARQKRSEA